MSASSSAASSDESEMTAASSTEFEATSSKDEDTNVSPFDSVDWRTADSLVDVDPEKDEKLRQEEASRLAEQIVSIVQIEKSSNDPVGDGTEYTEIRENADLWHYSPVFEHQPIPHGTGLDVHFSPPGLPMPAPFGGDHGEVGFQRTHSVHETLPDCPLTAHQEQIQNAYALTPKMPAMDAMAAPHGGVYGHITPKVVYEDHNAMVMMVEELDIEEPAQPLKLQQTGPRRMHSFDRSYDRVDRMDRRSRSYDEYSGNGGHRGHGPYGHYQRDDAVPKHHHSRIPRHRAEAIRESDIPPRFRKRKAPRDRATSFHSRRTKMHSLPHCVYSNGHHGPWYKDPADAMHHEQSSLMMRYSNQ
jgi:hypothetical protein